MVPPPEGLAVLTPNQIQHNDLRQALPVISENYETYHVIKAQLKGLQQYVNTLLGSNANE